MKYKIVILLLTFAGHTALCQLEVGAFHLVSELKPSSLMSSEDKALAKKLIASQKHVPMINRAGSFYFQRSNTKTIMLTAQHVFTGAKDTNPNVDFVFAEPKYFKNLILKNKVPYSGKLANAEVGQKIYALGYGNGAKISYSIGRVLSSQEINEQESKINKLDVFTNHIPFDSSIEIVAEGLSYQGMSGGAVFNSNGEFIGILIRGGEIKNQKPNDWMRGFTYFRVLKSDFLFRNFDETEFSN